jgi:AbrB family looped-hinge helix DNA binding protein
MTLAKVRGRYQITLPTTIRKKFNIVAGDFIDIEERPGGFFLKPVKMISHDQEYFYTKEWQANEAEADEDIRNGDLIGPFDNIGDALKALKKAKI